VGFCDFETSKIAPDGEGACILHISFLQMLAVGEKRRHGSFKGSALSGVRHLPGHVWRTISKKTVSQEIPFLLIFFVF